MQARAGQRPQLIQAVIDAFSIPELRARILFTLGMLVIFRFVAHVPVPGVDRAQLSALFETSGTGELLGMLAAPYETSVSQRLVFIRISHHRS